MKDYSGLDSTVYITFRSHASRESLGPSTFYITIPPRFVCLRHKYLILPTISSDPPASASASASTLSITHHPHPHLRTDHPPSSTTGRCATVETWIIDHPSEPVERKRTSRTSLSISFFVLQDTRDHHHQIYSVTLKGPLSTPLFALWKPGSDGERLCAIPFPTLLAFTLAGPSVDI